jgi:hypothetical protein
MERKGLRTASKTKPERGSIFTQKKLKEEPEENYKSEAIRYNIRNSLINIAGAK